MIVWTAEEAHKATNCKLLGQDNWEAMGIAIDSRVVKKGDLFIALKGVKSDGHDYIREAFLKGAAAVMVEKLPANFPSLSPVMMVENCLEALYRMAIFRRIQSRAKIIAVTGSVGKTSTKEMLNVAFSNFGLTHYSFGNNNNEIGVPLSLARMPKDAEYGIFELGMNHKNEISPLSKLVRPAVAIITNIAEVHIENFEKLEGIADAKAEIFDGMDKEGYAVLPADSEFFSHLTRKAWDKKVDIISFGETGSSMVKLLDQRDRLKENLIRASVDGEEIEYTIAARGRHMALNSLAVLGAVQALGLDTEAAANSLSNFNAGSGRGQIIHLKLGQNEITLIDDSYNASPLSMRVALENIGALEASGRRIAVIGDMLELGGRAEILHLSLEADILRNQIDKVYTVGPYTEKLFEKLPKRIQGKALDRADDVIGALQNDLKNGDVILLKSSHGTGLYKVAAELTKSQKMEEYAL